MQAILSHAIPFKFTSIQRHSHTYIMQGTRWSLSISLNTRMKIFWLPQVILLLLGVFKFLFDYEFSLAEEWNCSECEA